MELRVGDLVRKSAIEPYLAHKVQPLNFHLVRSPPRSAGFGGLFPPEGARGSESASFGPLFSPGVREMSGNRGHLLQKRPFLREVSGNHGHLSHLSTSGAAVSPWRPLSRAYVGTIIAANRAAFVRAAGPGGRAHPRARAGGRCPSIASSSEARTKIAMEGAGRSRRRLEFRKGRCLNEDN